MGELQSRLRLTSWAAGALASFMKRDAQGMLVGPGRSCRTYFVAATMGLLAFGCADGGTSTDEMKKAAIQQARERHKLADDVPLEASVWIGNESYNDQAVFCGTVSDRDADRMPPRRFAATGAPINWLVFEDAHDPLTTSRPDKFAEWKILCAKAQNV